MAGRALIHRHAIPELRRALDRHTENMERMMTLQVADGQGAAAKVLVQTVRREVLDRIRSRISLEALIDDVLEISESEGLSGEIWHVLETLDSENRVPLEWINEAGGPDGG